MKFTRLEKEYTSILCGFQFDDLDKELTPELYLNKAELEYTTQHLSDKRRIEFIAGRIASKIALQEALPHCNPHQWQITKGVFTQPVVEGPGALGICITHTNQTVMALAYPLEHPIGIDLENSPSATDSSIIFEHCGKEEIQQAIQVMGNETLAALKLWTSKESLSKILHTGLMTSFLLFEVNEIQNAALHHQSKFVHFPQYQSQSWLGTHHFFSLSFPANSILKVNTDEWKVWTAYFL